MVGEALPLRAILQALFSRKWTAATFFVVTATTILLILMAWPYSYRAQSSMLVKLGRENVNTLVVGSTSTQVLNTGLRKEDIVTQMEILRSRVLAEKAIDAIGIDVLDPPAVREPGLLGTVKWHVRSSVHALLDGFSALAISLALERPTSREERVVQGLMKRLNAEQIQQSNLIEVSIRWGDRDLAAKLLENVLDNYLELHLAAFSQPGQREFFSGQAETISARIAEAEGALAGLQQRERVYAGEAQERIVLERLAVARGQLQSTQAELAEIQAQMDDLRRRAAGGAGSDAIRQFVPDAVLGEQRRKLNELEQERARLQSRYLDDSEVIRNIDRELQLVRTSLREQEAELVQRQVRSLETRMSALQARQRAQQAQVSEHAAELASMTRHAAEIRRLQRQMRDDQESLSLYRSRVEDARISEVLDRQRIVNISVVQPPTASERPVAPRKLLIAILGLTFSAILAVGLALLFDYLDSSIRDVDDVEAALGLPYLGSVEEFR